MTPVNFKYVSEGMLAVVDPEEGINYGAVTSCLTATAVSPDGSKTAIHMVLVPSEEQTKASDLFKAFTSILRDSPTRTDSKVTIAGILDFWDPSYLGLENPHDMSIEDLLTQELTETCDVPKRNISITPREDEVTISFSPRGDILFE